MKKWSEELKGVLTNFSSVHIKYSHILKNLYDYKEKNVSVTLNKMKSNKDLKLLICAVQELLHGLSRIW